MPVITSYSIHYTKLYDVEAFFDVSFGAELTVKSYINYIKKNNPATVIAQPCPAIVNYIQIYRPELIEYLSPCDSPMLHTVKMIHKYYPQYAQHKVIAVSPCYAKKREFVITSYSIHYTKLYETGYSSLLDSDDARGIGINKIIIKPVSKKTLALAVRETLDN